MRIATFNRLLSLYCWFFTKIVSLEVVRPFKTYQHTNFIAPRCLVEVLHPPKRFERPPFWNS